MNWRLLLLIPLAGCATAQKPAPVVERVYLEVPVKVERDLPPEPLWAVDGLPIGAPIDEQVAALLAERRQAKAYIRQLQDVCR